MLKFAEIVGARSGGKMKVQEFGGGTLGGEQQQFSAAQGGVQEMVVLSATVTFVLAYAIAGLTGTVPWASDAASTTASGIWLAMAGGVLIAGTRRIRSVEFATSRRNAHRVAISAPVTVDGVTGELVDISVGGASVRLRAGVVPTFGLVELALPGAAPIKLEFVRSGRQADAGSPGEFASLRVADGDWAAYAALSRWMFHTPDGAIAGLPHGVPVVGCRRTAGV